MMDDTEAPGPLEIRTTIRTPAEARRWARFISDWFAPDDGVVVSLGFQKPMIETPVTIDPAPKRKAEDGRKGANEEQRAAAAAADWLDLIDRVLTYGEDPRDVARLAGVAIQALNIRLMHARKKNHIKRRLPAAPPAPPPPATPPAMISRGNPTAARFRPELDESESESFTTAQDMAILMAARAGCDIGEIAFKVELPDDVVEARLDELAPEPRCPSTIGAAMKRLRAQVVGA